MKKLYNEYFRIPANRKVREKVVLFRMIFAAIVVILLCLPSMCYTAYAVYTSNAVSSANKITAADFSASVTITDAFGAAADVTTADDRVFYANLPAGTYGITLTPAGSVETGFFLLNAEGSAAQYHTQQISENGQKCEITFTLVLATRAQVRLEAHWGTSFHYGYPGEGSSLYIRNTDEVNLPGSGEMAAADEAEDLADTTPDETVYVVQIGDTMESIADQYATAVERIMAYNALTSAEVAAGQELKIPPSDWEIPSTGEGADDTDSPDDGEDSADTPTDDTGSADDKQDPTDTPTDDTDGADDKQDAADTPTDDTDGADDKQDAADTPSDDADSADDGQDPADTPTDDTDGTSNEGDALNTDGE